MSTISIKYSQQVVDQQGWSSILAPQSNGMIGTLVDSLIVAGYTVGTAYASGSSWNLTGSTLRINFPDGATKTYTGVVLANQGATQGRATASGFEFRKDGVLTIAEAGTMNFDYSISASGDLSFSGGASGSSVTGFRVTTQLPPSSPAYTPLVGNVALGMEGALHVAASGTMSGSITKISATAEKFLLSAAIEGNFQVVANSLTVGQGLTTSAVTGLLTGYREDYRDGSHAHVTGVSTHLGATQQFDETMFSDAARFAAADDISIDLPGQIYRDFLMASGSGDDRISIKGGGGRLNVDAGSGNDRISLLGDTHRVDGGSGIDTVQLSTLRAGTRVEKTPAGFSVTDQAGVVNFLVNVERVAFSDVTVALDIAGNGGQAYRLYQAAFNRTPDSAGLGYWINVLDKGSSLGSVAAGFVESAEFKAAYGAAPSNRELVTKFYENILHRAPEAAGLEYWTQVLDRNPSVRPDVLAAISESGENQAGLIGVIGNGFDFTPYG